MFGGDPDWGMSCGRFYWPLPFTVKFNTNVTGHYQNREAIKGNDCLSINVNYSFIFVYINLS